MKITQPAHARLQIAIQEWLRKELPEAAPLFCGRGDYPDAEIRPRYSITADFVSMHAATAAYQSVIHSLDARGLVGLSEENSK